MATHFVFVYGTLKRGEPNERFMTLHGQVTFKGEGHILRRYPLVITTQWNLPTLLNVEGQGQTVQGEIYEVDDVALEKLDEFEDHPDLYVRTRVQIVLLDTKVNQAEKREGTVIDCWTYFYTECKPEYLELPTFESYSSKGDHGLVYDTTELDS